MASGTCMYMYIYFNLVIIIIYYYYFIVCDGVYGSVPHIAIEDEDELLIKLHNNNEELVTN